MRKQLLTLAVVLALGLMSLASGWAKNTSLSGVINTNTATAEQLMLLPGIGEAKAKLILDARAAKPFQGKEDLLAVKGIGEKLLEQWSSHIAFSGETTLKEAADTASAPAARPAQ